MRIRSASLKRNEEGAAKAKAALEACNGVEEVRVNTLTGSIVIHYESGVVSPSKLMRILGVRTADQRARQDNAQPTSGLGELILRATAGCLFETALERSMIGVLSAILW